MTGPDEKLATTLERLAGQLTTAAKDSRLGFFALRDIGEVARELLVLATADADPAGSAEFADKLIGAGIRDRAEALRRLLSTHAVSLGRGLEGGDTAVVTHVAIIRGYAAALALAELGVEVQS